jgi:Tfp pilus assembly protein PilV
MIEALVAVALASFMVIAMARFQVSTLAGQAEGRFQGEARQLNRGALDALQSSATPASGYDQPALGGMAYERRWTLGAADAFGFQAAGVETSWTPPKGERTSSRRAAWLPPPQAVADQGQLIQEMYRISPKVLP